MPAWNQSSVIAIPSFFTAVGTQAAGLVLQAGGRLAVAAPPCLQRELKEAFRGERNVNCYVIDEDDELAPREFFEKVYEDFGTIDAIIIDATDRSSKRHSLKTTFRKLAIHIDGAMAHANHDLLLLVCTTQPPSALIEIGSMMVAARLSASQQIDCEVRLMAISATRCDQDLHRMLSKSFADALSYKTSKHTGSASEEMTMSAE